MHAQTKPHSLLDINNHEWVAGNLDKCSAGKKMSKSKDDAMKKGKEMSGRKICPFLCEVQSQLLTGETKKNI